MAANPTIYETIFIFMSGGNGIAPTSPPSTGASRSSNLRFDTELLNKFTNHLITYIFITTHAEYHSHQASSQR